MTVFSYKAFTKKQKKQQGVVNANNRQEALDSLRKQGMMVIHIQALEKSSLQCHLQNENLINFTKQTAQMLHAGIPLYESLLSIEEQNKGEKFHPILIHLCDAIKRGVPLSKAMEAFPKSFNKLYRSLVKSGESSGTLGETLKGLAKLLSQRQKMKKQLITGMIYPTVLACFSFLLLISLVAFVIPSFEAIFSERPASGITAIVFSTSRFFQKYWLFHTSALLISALLIFRKLRTPSGKKILDKALLRIPILQNFIKQAAFARFSRTMFTLQTGGIPLVESLQISRNTMMNGILEDIIMNVENKIVEGGSLSVELKKFPLVPKMIVRMLAIGEESGSLATMFRDIADIYDDEVKRTQERIIALAQPAILIFMGGVIAFILLAVLLPLTDIESLSRGIR